MVAGRAGAKTRETGSTSGSQPRKDCKFWSSPLHGYFVSDGCSVWYGSFSSNIDLF